jgi:hypothetical protein
MNISTRFIKSCYSSFGSPLYGFKYVRECIKTQKPGIIVRSTGQHTNKLTSMLLFLNIQTVLLAISWLYLYCVDMVRTCPFVILISNIKKRNCSRLKAAEMQPGYAENINKIQHSSREGEKTICRFTQFTVWNKQLVRNKDARFIKLLAIVSHREENVRNNLR